MTYEQLQATLMEYYCDCSRAPTETKSGLLEISEQALKLAEIMDESPEEGT